MAQIKAKDTKPEMVVRRLAHSLGYRYRLHGSKLPGKPDLVFASKKKVVFVHGCFWHRHDDPNCTMARMPKSRLEYWGPKLEGNKARDQANVERLREMGWEVLTIWGCQLKDVETLERTLTDFLGTAPAKEPIRLQARPPGEATR